MFICGKINAFLLAAVVLSCLAFLLELLAVSLPNWMALDQVNTKDTYVGLFQTCISITNHDHVCRYFSQANVSVDAYWNANAAMQVLGLACILVAFILGLCALFCCRKRSLIFLMATIFAFVAGVFIIIGVIVFAAKNDQRPENFHASFYLALFAFTFAVVSGIFFIIAKSVQFG